MTLMLQWGFVARVLTVRSISDQSKTPGAVSIFAHFIPLSQILNVVTAATLPAESVGHHPAVLPAIRLKSAANSMSLTVRLPPPPPPPPPPVLSWFALLPPQEIRPARTSRGRPRARNLRNVLELDSGDGLLDIRLFPRGWGETLTQANIES